MTETNGLAVRPDDCPLTSTIRAALYATDLKPSEDDVIGIVTAVKEDYPLEVLEEWLKYQRAQKLSSDGNVYPYIWYHSYQKNWWLADDLGNSGRKGDFIDAVRALREALAKRSSLPVRE